MYIYSALCKKVIDGNTIVADIDLGFDVWLRSQVLRLYGVDAYPGASIELAKRILGQKITVSIRKSHLPDVPPWFVVMFLEGCNINDWLLRDNWAVPFGAYKPATPLDVHEEDA